MSDLDLPYMWGAGAGGRRGFSQFKVCFWTWTPRNITVNTSKLNLSAHPVFTGNIPLTRVALLQVGEWVAYGVSIKSRSWWESGQFVMNSSGLVTRAKWGRWTWPQKESCWPTRRLSCLCTWVSRSVLKQMVKALSQSVKSQLTIWGPVYLWMYCVFWGGG